MNDKIRVSAVYFNRKEENFVFYDNITGTYGNASETIDAQGAEIELNWQPNDKIRLSSNYTFTERKGDTAIRLPNHKVNASLGYAFSKKTYASMDYRYTGQRFDTDFNTFSEIALEPFSILDINAEHELLPNKLKFFLGISNVFNAEYTEIIGFTTRGRNIRAGFNMTL
jgi:vitamin B12 transporter